MPETNFFEVGIWNGLPSVFLAGSVTRHPGGTTTIRCNHPILSVVAGAVGNPEEIVQAVATSMNRDPSWGPPPSEPAEIGSPWEWWAGDNEEFYQSGPHGSRGAAILAGRADFGPDRQLFVIEAASGRWSPPDADTIINEMMENADDLFVEETPDLEGPADDLDEAKAELQLALNHWFRRHSTIFPTPTSFAATRNAEILAPALAGIGRLPADPDGDNCACASCRVEPAQAAAA